MKPESRSPSKSSSLQCQLDETVQKGRKGDSRRGSGLGEQAGLGHAGNRIRFENEDIVSRYNHVGAAVPPAIECAMSAKSQMLGLPGQGF